MAETLAKGSVYEQTFKTRYRGSGRPSRDDTEDVLFPTDDLDPTIAAVARRRAYAVVHEEQRRRLNEIFHSEVKVLRRRGLEQVATDARITLPESDGLDEFSSAGSRRG